MVANRAESGSDDHATAWHAESKALGALVAKKFAIWQELCSGGTWKPAIARAKLSALLSAFTAGCHVRLFSGPVRSPTCFNAKMNNAAD